MGANVGTAHNINIGGSGQPGVAALGQAPVLGSGQPRVVVLAGQEMVGQVLVGALEMRGYRVILELVTEESLTSAQLISSIARKRIDVVVVSQDVGPVEASVGLVQRLSRTGAAVVALTTSVHRYHCGRYLLAGARTVLPYTSSLPELLSAVRSTAAGKPCMPRTEREALIAEWSIRAQEYAAVAEKMSRLTANEKKVLAGLMNGLTVTEIAKARTVAVATVRTQVKSILAKLEVSSQVSAVGVARRLQMAA